VCFNDKKIKLPNRSSARYSNHSSVNCTPKSLGQKSLHLENKRKFMKYTAENVLAIAILSGAISVGSYRGSGTASRENV